jgi:5-hydroxyisourate hydrolase
MTTVEQLSTHVLDTTVGRPAAGIDVLVQRLATDGGATEVGGGITDDDGRTGRLNSEPLEPGDYRLVFRTAEYFQSTHGTVFYPRIVVEIRLPENRSSFHIPVLIGAYTYSTYLGS